MSEISRILTNLGLAYGLGTKEQFIDAVANYAQERNLNDETIREIIEQVFEEIELTNRRRKARQVMEAVEMERDAEDKEKINFKSKRAGDSDEKLDEVVLEIRALRRSVESLVDALNKSNKEEE